MNAYINYFIEANLGLLMLLVVYHVLLSGETDFRRVRVLLLAGILLSLGLPLIHIAPGSSPVTLSIGQVIPSYWLPEVVVGTEGVAPSARPAEALWSYAYLAYWVGFSSLAVIVLFHLVRLIRLIRGANTYQLGGIYIAESRQNTPTFSFFHFIFIGNADELSDSEKRQIILHESVHARQWHSFDILLLNVLRIAFWFNPFLTLYKKIFIQLHEFEADARAVESSEVNKYCNLLARVALKSAGFTLANHFNNSLTVKRIEMMRTIKHEIKRWKLVALAAIVPLFFFFIACQDQVGDDIMQIAQNSSHALIVPDFVQAKYEQLKKDNPGKTYALLELNETASQKLNELEKQYGIPKSMEVFRSVDGKPVGEPIKGRSEDGLVVVGHRPPGAEASTSGFGTGAARQSVNGERTFAIIEYNDEASKVAEASQQDRIYTVVEQAPEFQGGYDAMMLFLRQNIRYPLEARQQGIEGTVYVSFVIGKDGTLSDSKVIRGISPEADAEALRVMRLSPPWTPGKQNKQPVAVRFVLPIKFQLTEPAKPTN